MWGNPICSLYLKDIEPGKRMARAYYQYHKRTNIGTFA